MHVADFRTTRFQSACDRVIGDSQVRIEDMRVANLELMADSGEFGWAPHADAIGLLAQKEARTKFALRSWHRR